MQNDAVRLYASCFGNESSGVQGMHLIEDSIFIMPSLWFADELVRQNAKVRMYRFDRKTDARTKAMHAADQTYLFNKLDTHAARRIAGLPRNEEEKLQRERLSHAVQDTILGFARYGDSNNHENGRVLDWPFYNEQERPLMSFDFDSKTITDPARDRRIWWYENVYGPALKMRK